MKVIKCLTNKKLPSEDILIYQITVDDKKNLDPSLHYRNCDQQKCIVSLQCLYAVTRLVIPNFSIKCGIITSISLNFLNRSEMRPYTFVTGDLEGSVMCSLYVYIIWMMLPDTLS